MTAQPESARFYVLGPLEVRRAGEPIAIPSGRERALLAVLLLRGNRLVTVDELVETVWGEQPPDNPRATVQTVVMRLRKKLPDGSALIHTDPGGYSISPRFLDLEAFRGHVAAAAEAANVGDGYREAAELRAGLALWRGPILANVPSVALHRDVLPALVEERLTALQRRIEVDLDLGNPGGLVPELRALIAEHPLREGMWALLMRALRASGRQAEALAAFETIRQRLADELGADPGKELRDLHQVMLSGADPAPAGTASQPVPRQLPPDVREFTGRAGELETLDGLLATRGGGAVVITAIAGTAGVGKTALAAHWARRVAHRFPDGQLWVNLRGYDPDQPLNPAQALSMFLRALGVPGAEIPLELDARVGLFRSLLADRQVLLVLDNAGSADQVRPLLPGAPGCLALITSRDELPGLVARDGATRVRLGLLDRPDSVRLLRRLVRAGHTDDDALERLALLCARLPLALRVAADRVSGTDEPLRQAVAAFAEEPRLDALAAGGDPLASARAVFSWSYRALPSVAAILFRRLGLIPGGDWDAYTAAALVDGEPVEVRRSLAVLATGNLIDQREGRYQMHDLLRAYAADRSRAEDGERQHRVAVTGLLDYYLAAVVTAMETAFPYEAPVLPNVSVPGRHLVPLDDDNAAIAWLDTERANLVRIILFAGRESWTHRHAINLGIALRRYLLGGSHHDAALTVYQTIRDIAVESHDRGAEGVALHYLGTAYGSIGHYEKSFEYFTEALASYEDADDKRGQANVLRNLGILYLRQGKYDEAFERFEKTLTAFRDVGDRSGEARCENSLGDVLFRWGRYDEAYQHYGRALDINREIGNRENQGYALTNLGHVDLRQGRAELAFHRYTQALELYREIGDREGEADALTSLGWLHARRTDPETALKYHLEAIERYREIGNRAGEAEALNGAGEASRAAGRAEVAVSYHESARTTAKELGETFEQSRALEGLGHAWHELGEPARAREYWQAALDSYSELGVAEADRVRERLAALAIP